MNVVRVIALVAFTVAPLLLGGPAHAALDIAILTACDFSAKRDLLAQLLALNQEFVAKIAQGGDSTARTPAG